jgi:hypothetical protein
MNINILFTTLVVSLMVLMNISSEPYDSMLPNSVEYMTVVNTGEQLYFKDLRKYRMGARQVPAEIKKYDGQTVSIVGFMVPFDSIEKLDKFILLQAPFMGCFHIPPPQPNESVLINTKKAPSDYTYEPIRITGKLKIEETYIENYLVSMYSIDATTIKVVSQNDAELDGLPASFHMFGEF